jgi:hypothetical protein
MWYACALRDNESFFQLSRKIHEFYIEESLSVCISDIFQKRLIETGKRSFDDRLFHNLILNISDFVDP